MKKNFLTFAVVLATASFVAAQDSIKTVLLDDVVVTGQYEPQSVKKSVYQVRTITYDRIRSRGATDILSVLRTELGMRFSNDLTLGTSDVSLMGMGGQNVKILLDGVPLLDRGATRESINQIDINTIERIEIVEGPMSVIYGTDALAGVINIISKKYDDKKVTIEARIQEETAGKEYALLDGRGVHNESVGVTWRGKTWNAAGTVTRNDFGGWQGSFRRRKKEWNVKDQWLGAGSVGFDHDDLTASYRLNYVNEAITAAGDININTNVATDKVYRINRYMHMAQADGNINERLSFAGVASYQDYSRRTQTTTIDMTTGERRLTIGAGEQDEAKFSSAMVRGMFLYKPSERFSWQPGFDINLTNGTGERIDGDRSIADYAFFVTSEIKAWRSVSIRPGLRFNYNSVYDAPPAIPSLNTKLSLARSLDLRLAYAYGFRAPALRELYFSFHDASHDIDGNPALKAEYSNSFSGSLAWQAFTTPLLRIQTTLGGFYNTFHNQIVIATVNDPGQPTGKLSRYDNVYRSRTLGSTLENTFAWNAFTATLGFSYIGVADPLKAENGSLDILWSPEVNTVLSHRFKRAKMSASLFYKFTGKRSNYELATVDNVSATRLAAQESFHFADASLIKKITPNLELIGGVKNIFNITTLQNSSANSGGAHSTGSAVPMSYGRSYFFALNFQFTH
ncbi:MAG TPA: TonB-dependent receptor [Ohtaekwangia sp.]|nr:TonB-dependent receptor [Ohtaekwangia sp.]